MAVVLALAACASPAVTPVSMPAVEQVFATERAFAQTMARRDLAAFTTFLSDEAVFFSGPTPLQGKQAVAAWWSRFFADAPAPFSWEPEQVEVLESGSLALSTGPVKNPAGRLIGHFTSVWRQDAPGVWRIVFDTGGPPKATAQTPGPAPEPTPESAHASTAVTEGKISDQSVVEFLNRFEALAEKEDFNLIEDMVHEQAFFRFNDGDFIGRAAVRSAFEKTWKSAGNAKKERFYLSDIVVLHTDASSAAATYTFHWEGVHEGKPLRIQGRGTRVLVKVQGRLQIVHEHLSRFPKAP